MKKLTVVTCFSILSVGAASAQEFSHLAFQVGAGFTEPVGATGRYTDVGWNVGGGVGWNFNHQVGALLDLNYNSMGMNSTTLAVEGAPGGGVHVFSATIDPIVHLTPKAKFDVYVTGGGGMYRMEQDLTAPTVGYYTGFNPFFGYYTGAYGATAVLASNSTVKPGVDGGIGVAFGSKWHGKFFAEARYNHIYLNNSHLDYLPVTFGFRW
jgi:hypothetical protein